MNPELVPNELAIIAQVVNYLLWEPEVTGLIMGFDIT